MPKIISSDDSMNVNDFYSSWILWLNDADNIENFKKNFKYSSYRYVDWVKVWTAWNELATEDEIDEFFDLGVEVEE